MPTKKIEYQLDGAGLQHGRKLHIGLCADPNCLCVHMLFADEDDKPFAMVALSIDQAIAVMGDLRMYIATLQLAELDRPQQRKRDVDYKRRGADDGEHD